MVKMRRYKFGQASVNRTWHWLLTGARKRGWQGYINGPRGGLRSYLQQAQLYALYRAGRGAPAFPPNGPSRHMIRNVKKRGQWSQAVDVTGAEQLIRIAENMGVVLHRPYPNEPWHVEAAKPFHCPKSYRP